MRLCVLGSGSGGNCSLLILDQGGEPRFVLIDLGLSPRATAARLKPLGVTLSQISAALITHFDTDHFYPTWPALVARHNITLHVHRRHRQAALSTGLSLRHVQLHTECVSCDLCDRIDSAIFAHDQLGSAGYVIEHKNLRLGFATDLGRVSPSMFDFFSDLHALAIESNYDRAMQLASGRPAFLKRRIMGGAGHLSNEQSLDAVLQIAARSRLSHVVLLHLSRQCNDPAIIKCLYARHANDLWPRVTITNQFQATGLLQVAANGPPARVRCRHDNQLALFA